MANVYKDGEKALKLYKSVYVDEKQLAKLVGIKSESFIFPED